VGDIKCSKCGSDFDPNYEQEIVGAFVLDPVVGVHQDVYVLDFKSLYPSVNSYSLSLVAR